MGTGLSIRNSVRVVITKYGNSVSLYSYSSATKTTNDEGETTVSNWGTASSIKVISSNHYALRRILARQGEENNMGDRVLWVRDDVTIGVRDKVVIGSDTYYIDEVKNVDPIEDVLIAKRIVLFH